MRYRIRAWGHETLPDLNYESSAYPEGISYEYPWVDIVVQRTVPISELMDNLYASSSLRRQGLR